MQFRIADTFTDSLAKLMGQEQKLVKTTAFDLQMDPSSPGLRYHKLDRARDQNFWSVSVNMDLRLIVHRTGESLLLCYVAHHDDAYRWAERRRLETHPKTGAAQLVEVRETVREIVIPSYVLGTAVAAAQKPLLFADRTEDELLSHGVPAEWVSDVLAADEDSLLELADHLPAEAAEALLDIATGGSPTRTPPVVLGVSPFEHPDAQRRFRVMNDVEELRRALDYPWEKWTVFLHPAQRAIVERAYTGPARVSGSAGTGKTIVALHRAVHLARDNADARVLLTTFSDTLAKALRTKLRRLISNEPRLAERLEVHSLNALGRRLYELNISRAELASRAVVREVLDIVAIRHPGHGFSPHFLLAEWEHVIDAWQLTTWEAYRDVRRLGRKTRLPEKWREVLWSIYEEVRTELGSRSLVTQADMFSKLADVYLGDTQAPFDFAIVDEAQDIGVAQLRFLAALAADRPNGLFFAGDLGQRIFHPPFSWLALGVDVRGRSKTLRINYRTSHQIRMKVDRLLGPELSDVDGNKEDRRGAISVFNGPAPIIQLSKTPQEEASSVSQWLKGLLAEGLQANEIGVFVRSEAQLERARAAADSAGVRYKILDESVETTTGYASVSTMHLAKGLEFRAVAVMACDDEIVPSQERIEQVADDADLEEVYNTERHLLYVACTRARDQLLITGLEPGSEFLDDIAER